MKMNRRKSSAKRRKIRRTGSKLRHSNKRHKYTRTRKLRGGDPNETHIIKLWASWCGHCQDLDKIWDGVVRAASSETVKFHDVEEKQMDVKMTAINDKLGTKLIEKPKGFPTILKLKNNKVTQYEGPRDEASITEWTKE